MFYFFYFALLGALLPYWSLYLQSREFNLVEIGKLMAILLGTKIVAPNIWGWVADKTGKRLTVIRCGAILTVVCFSGVFLEPGFWGLATVMIAFSFFWNAILPQFEVLTLNYLHHSPEKYSGIRLWGSIGFIVTSVGFGWAIEVSSVDHLPLLLWLNMLLIWLSSLSIKDLTIEHAAGLEHSFVKQLMQPNIVIFFVVCFLMQLSHGPYYVFFTLYLSEFEYSKFAIGWLWALGVIAEVGMFMVMHRLLKDFSVKFLCIISLFLASIRWVITGYYAEYVLLVFIAQLLHGATFGVFHAVSIHMVQKYFSPKTAGQGQALYSAISFGAGGAIGAYISGYIWDVWGGAATFYMAGAFAFLAFVLGWLFLVEPQQKVAVQTT